MQAVIENPSFLAQQSAESMVNMASTMYHSDDAKKRAVAAAGTERYPMSRIRNTEPWIRDQGPEASSAKLRKIQATSGKPQA